MGKQHTLITLDDIKTNPTATAYIQKANDNLGSLGFTEHGFRHNNLVADTAYRILIDLGYSLREAELAAIAGYLHDIGNVVERTNHYTIGALIAMDILKEMGMDKNEIAEIASAIGNHDEQHGHPVSNISAAVILADKSDVHRSRVRNRDLASFDIHDRVNYAAEESALELDPKRRIITLRLQIDTSISRVMEYFEIFLSRMIMCRRAADFLSSRFALVINEAQLL
ncbi:MAG TPA: HD domain-containing protein [Firmicutes bacterium]|jgi:metal-dependent HD superfamily phosphatase/phosphodiesterase|nr:HD domain-containing protein [Bacillota bacterium]